MAVKVKKPGIFEVFKMHARPLQITGNPDDMVEMALKNIKEDPEIGFCYDKCYKIMSEIGLKDIWLDSVREPWMTIIHSDFWVNNILFHCSEGDRIDSVKFVDFQMYVYSSSVRDLLFYLFSSVRVDVTDEQLDGLMDLYYDTLVNRLSKMGCDTTAMSKEGFREKMAEDSQREFVHLCIMIKVFTLDIHESNFSLNNMQDSIAAYKGNQAYIDRLRKIVLYFSKYNWI